MATVSPRINPAPRMTIPSETFPALVYVPIADQMAIGIGVSVDPTVRLGELREEPHRIHRERRLLAPGRGHGAQVSCIVH